MCLFRLKFDGDTAIEYLVDFTVDDVTEIVVFLSLVSSCLPTRVLRVTTSGKVYGSKCG